MAGTLHSSILRVELPRWRALYRIRKVGRARGDMSGAAESTLPALPADAWAKRRDNPMILRLVDWRDCSALEHFPGGTADRQPLSGVVSQRNPGRLDLHRRHPRNLLRYVRDRHGFCKGCPRIHDQQPTDGHGRHDRLSLCGPHPLGGQYYGPDGFMGAVGRYPVVVTSSSRSYDAETQRRLWEVSEELTGVTFPFERTARHHQEAPKGEPS